MADHCRSRLGRVTVVLLLAKERPEESDLGREQCRWLERRELAERHEARRVTDRADDLTATSQHDRAVAVRRLMQQREAGVGGDLVLEYDALRLRGSIRVGTERCVEQPRVRVAVLEPE